MRYFNYQEFEDSATARRDGIDNSLTPAGKNPKEVVEKITETVGEFVVGAVQSDDITLLSISYKG